MIYPGVWQRPVTLSLEQGEILDYSQTEKIDRVRRANAQRHMPTGSGKHQNTERKNGQKHSKIMICTYFNQNTCNFTKTHETKGVLYRHICATCYTTGKKFPHSEADCRQKFKNAKKRFVMDVGGTRYHIHQAKTFVTKDSQKVKEYQATPGIWQTWWNIHKAFANKRDGRTFAQVLSQNKACKQLSQIHKVTCEVSHKNAGLKYHKTTRPHEKQGQIQNSIMSKGPTPILMAPTTIPMANITSKQVLVARTRNSI